MGDRTPLEGSLFYDLMRLRSSTSARVSSWDRSGGNFDFRRLPAGETLELADIRGAGCLRHLYFTILGRYAGDPAYLRELVLRAYWDGEREPSIETPFGDFFGQGHGRIRFFRSLMVTVNEGAELLGAPETTLTVGLNSYFPMPFSDGARLTLANEGHQDVGNVWYHIDHERFDRLDPALGRFHAQWRRQNPTMAIGEPLNTTDSHGKNLDGKHNYVILEASGHGNFVGYFLNVHNFSKQWWGEGDDMIFIDGAPWPPSLPGTGTEECFGGGACPNREYAGPYTGFPLISNKDFQGKTSMYRFHVADPLRFQTSIKVTIEHGHANNFANDYSSTAFWYQQEPHAAFPHLPPVEERMPVTGGDPADVAYAGLDAILAAQARLGAAVREKRVAEPSKEQTAALEGALSVIGDAFRRRDWAAAAKRCQTALERLQAMGAG